MRTITELMELPNCTNTKHSLVSRLNEIASTRDISYNEAISFLYDVLLRYSHKTRPFYHLAFLEEVFGQDHPKYQAILKNHQASAKRSTFEYFHAKVGGDEATARKLYNAKFATNSVAGVMKRRNVDEETAKRILKDRYIKMRQTYALKSDEEMATIRKKKGMTLENYINRYGEVEGTKEYERICGNRSGMGTVDWYKEKFGEEGERIFQEKRRDRSKIYYTKEYWVAKGMSDAEASLKLETLFSERPNFSKAFCIQKYGYDEGIKVWKARTELWQKSLNDRSQDEIDRSNKAKGMSYSRYIEKYGLVDGHNKFLNKTSRNVFSSKEANCFFLRLYKKLRCFGVLDGRDKAFLGVGRNSEYFIRTKDNIYFYDFAVPSYKIIVEYNGSAFHPKEGDTSWKNHFGQTYESILTKDKFKEYLARSKGYDFYVVWDTDNLEEKLEELTMIFLEKEEVICV